ncbi:MAG: hypothetical protein ACJ76N_14470 [Thermoanaerobaculia bacterium]
MADDVLLEALKHEDNQVNGRMQELLKSLYAILGTVLPGAVAVFTFVAKEQGKLKVEEIAFAFIAVVSLSSLWTNSLWMDLFPFLRYKYLVLQPEILKASGQKKRKSLLSFLSPRPFVRWIPTLLFNALSIFLVTGVWLRLIPTFNMLWWGSVPFVAAAIVGTASVITVARRIEKEFIASLNGEALRKNHYRTG